MLVTERTGNATLCVSFCRGEWFCNLCDKIDDIRLVKADTRELVKSGAGAMKRRSTAPVLTDRERKVRQLTT